jgi:hypothetical protein
MRWYDAETGRWLSKDPIGLSGGLNLYVFCGNTPIAFVDSFGLSWWDTVTQLGSDVIDGYIRGDFIENPNLANSIGSIAAGLTPIWGQISDARDTVANIRNVWGHPCDIEAWKGLGLCCVGWIPGLGDAAKSGGKLYKGAGKAAGRVTRRGFATAAEARNAAKQLGLVDTHRVDSRGQAIFKKGNRYFSRDVDGHGGSAWKEWKDAGAHERLGSLDRDLNRIRD